MGRDIEYYKEIGLKWQRATNIESLLEKSAKPKLQTIRHRAAHYPTDAGSCMRARILSWLGARATDGDSLQSHFVFSMGDAMGKTLTQLFMQSGVYVTDDEQNDAYATFEVEGLRFPMSGRIDIVITDPFYYTYIGAISENDSFVPVEIKTIKENGFKTSFWEDSGKLRWWGTDNVPKLDHVMQLHHYMHYLNTNYGYLMYFSKNTQEYRIWRVDWNEKLWSSIVEEAKATEKFLEENIVPIRHPNGNMEFYKRSSTTNTIIVGEDYQPKIIEIKKEKGDLKETTAYPCIWAGGGCKFRTLCYFKEYVDNANDSTRGEAEKRLVAAGYDPEDIYKNGVRWELFGGNKHKKNN